MLTPLRMHVAVALLPLLYWDMMSLQIGFICGDMWARILKAGLAQEIQCLLLPCCTGITWMHGICNELAHSQGFLRTGKRKAMLSSSKACSSLAIPDFFVRCKEDEPLEEGTLRVQ